MRVHALEENHATGAKRKAYPVYGKMGTPNEPSYVKVDVNTGKNMHRTLKHALIVNNGVQL